MNILLVNTSDIQGGAARATYRLHQALLAEGVNSKMLVQIKSSDDYTVLGPDSKLQKGFSKLRPALDNLPRLLYKNRSQTYFSSACLPFSNIVTRINTINPDLVHLHWVAGGMLPIEDIAKIKAPIVWSLHDNWAFTGGCHIMWECERFKQSCGACPRLGSTKEDDLSRKIFKRKLKSFSNLTHLTIVGLSRWISDCASQSSLFRNSRIITLPNPINTLSFSPIKQLLARELLHLPQNKKLILFGAMNATTDLNKGYKKICEALRQLTRDDIELVVFGSSQPQQPQGFNFKSHFLGHLYDDLTLQVLYSAADVMVVPSLQEAFGQTASESMSCGTPVVAFGSTGLLDIVDHKRNGYLAEPFDETDLAKGIEWVLNAKNYAQLCTNAREKIVTTFDSRLVVKQYINLYREVLSV